MDCSMPGYAVHHHFPNLAQTHVHQVGDAIQPSHPLSFPSPAFSLSTSGSFPVSQFFASEGQIIGVSASASVLPMNIQDLFPLGKKTGWFPCSPWNSQESFLTSQFKSISSSVLSHLYVPTLTSIHDCWENHSFDSTDFCQLWGQGHWQQQSWEAWCWHKPSWRRSLLAPS